MESQEPVPVYTVNNPTEAELMRNALQEEGIVCEIGGEGQAGFAGVFQIQLFVKAGDVERARQVIEELESQRTDADDEAEE